MKNREKFRDEIAEAIKEDNELNEKLCCFVKDNVIPRFVSEENMEEYPCGDMNCRTCVRMFAFWLDEEYEEPQKPAVDWSKVPVDTLVMVKDFEREEWVLRYFKGIDENCEESKYMTWIAGATSKTAYGFTEYWNYCELVEDEDDSNQNGI